MTLIIRPKTKATPVHGLDKVPDSVLLQNALIENGKLQSYIQEFEDAIKELKNKPHTPEEKAAMSAAMKDAPYKHLQEKYKLSRKEVKKLSEEVIQLKIKIHRIQNQTTCARNS